MPVACSVETFGKERADDLLMLVRRSQEAAQGNLAKLQRTDRSSWAGSAFPDTADHLRGACHPTPKRASMVLDNLSEEHKVVSDSALGRDAAVFARDGRKVAHILHRRLESVGDTARKSYSGFKAVADLLNRLNAEESKKILNRLKRATWNWLSAFATLMFTFEDLVTVPAATIREIVSGVDKRLLAMALRGPPKNCARRSSKP